MEQEKPMKQELWLNLPSKDLKKSKAFFLALGFTPTRDTPGMIGFNIGQVPVMMVEESQFEQYSGQRPSDTSNGSELLISVSALTPKYVDEIAEKTEAAGGTVFSKPQDIQGWMYGMAMIDPDGHRWNFIYMDWDNMPKEL